MNRITIPGKPIPMPRPRFSKFSGKPYSGGSRVRNRKDEIATLGRMVCAAPLLGPVALQAVFYLPIPVVVDGRRLRKAQREALAGSPATCKPDLDNLEKLVLDALNGVAYHDDSQVVRLATHKLWSRTPRTEVSWTELTVQFPDS